MKKEPVTTFLKIMSIITLIWAVLGILINAVAVFVAPLAEETTGAPIDMMTWIALAVSTVCMIINFVLAIRALQHKGVGTAYRIATFTLMALIVFNAVNGGGVRGYFAVLVSAVIPVLFVIALAKQDKLEREQ